METKQVLQDLARHVSPWDEALATVSLDLGGRSYLVIDADFKAPKVGEFSTQMVDHFFEAVAQNAKINMHAHVYGDNDHHKIEALFKAFRLCS